MRTKKLWKFCSSVLVVALSMNMCLFNTSASNTEGTGYLLSTPSNAQEYEEIEDDEMEIENDIVATPSDLTKPEKAVQYDPQPKSLEEVQELIDTYNASLADEPTKPHWEFLVQEEFMPEMYYCALVEDDEEFGAEYYTFFPNISIRTMALNNGWDGTVATSFAGGTGTASDPYLISHASELAFLRYSLDVDPSPYIKAYYKMTNDIDLNEVEWIPIGQYVDPDGKIDYRLLNVTFDGCGYSIKGLKINSEDNGVGLFGTLVSYAHIKNLNLVDVDVYGNAEVGGLAGRSGGIIENCSVSGIVQARLSAGGLVGYMITFSPYKSSSRVIKDCVNYADVTSVYLELGIYARGSAGGIASHISSHNVSGCANYGDVTGGYAVGGLSATGASTKYDRCFNQGTVTGTPGSYVGGLLSKTNSDVVKNCYNVGTINGTEKVGGLFGDYMNSGSSITQVENCYNAGTVTGDTETGALIGTFYKSYYSAPRITNSYYLEGTYPVGMGLSKFDNPNYAVPLKDFSMLHTSLGSAFEEDAYGVNQGFPVLVNGVYAQPNASDSAKVFFNTDLSYGVTELLYDYLDNMGYTPSRLGNPLPATVLDSFGNSAVVHVVSHGGPGVLALLNGNLTANQISNNYSSLSTKFVFLQGCETAPSSTTNGDLDDTLRNLGVECTIAFNDKITAGTDENGVHRFVQLFYEDMYFTETDVRVSMSRAYARFETEYDPNNMWGVDSIVVSGNTNIILR